MGDEKRKKYNSSNPRLPVFYERFHDLTNYVGGVTKVSELTGISRPTVQFWYNGERTPDAENLCTLSRAFGVSVDYLLGLANKDNSTNDEKLRMVSEYTGLSNDAINVVAKIYNGYISDDLSKMLCNDKFLGLIVDIYGIYEDANCWLQETMHFIDLLESKSEIDIDDEDIRWYLEFLKISETKPENLFDTVLASFSKQYRELRLLVFELSEEWSAFIESEAHYKAILERAKELYNRLIIGV